jgi:hypothetical protein
MTSENELDGLRAFVSRRPSVRRDRTSGPDALAIDSLGDTREFWGATGAVAAGGTATVYLTMDLTVGSDNVFSMLPNVEVYWDEDRTAGGFPRAGMPLAPSSAMTLVPHTNFRVKWLPSPNELFAVVVTNDTGGVTGFQIHARGV